MTLKFVFRKIGCFHDLNEILFCNYFKQSSERVYYQIDTLEKLVAQDQKDGKPLMIGEENISEFLRNSDVQNKKWNVSTLSTQEIQGKIKVIHISQVL